MHTFITNTSLLTPVWQQMHTDNTSTSNKRYIRQVQQFGATKMCKTHHPKHKFVNINTEPSSRPRSWSLGNATLVVAERSGWRRVLGVSKLRPSAKGAHRYRKRACLETLRLATTKLSEGLVIHPEDTLPNSESPEEAQENTDGTGFHTCKECHKTESLWNHTTADHNEGERLEDRRSVGASNCNSGVGPDQRVQSLMFMLMMMMTIYSAEFYLQSSIVYVSKMADSKIIYRSYRICGSFHSMLLK